MKKKIKVIEKIDIDLPKKPIFPGTHYTYEKIEYQGKVFYRRNKITRGTVSSCSYSYDIHTKRWQSRLNSM